MGLFEQIPGEFRAANSEGFLHIDSETFHLQMVSAGFRISNSCSDVYTCACDKSPVSYVTEVPERSSHLILEGVKIVKRQ